MQERYRGPDAAAAGAFQWQGPDSATYVMVDVQSTIPGLVQARADLWFVTDTGLTPVGRSEVMIAAAEIGVFAFEDLTGDGLPDLLGYVADSAGTSYAIFVPGAVGAMTEELQAAAAGWRFTAETDSLPRVGRDVAGAACYLQLWAEEPTPDGAGAGWRYLRLGPGGRLGAPVAAGPGCGPAAAP